MEKDVGFRFRGRNWRWIDWRWKEHTADDSLCVRKVGEEDRGEGARDSVSWWRKEKRCRKRFSRCTAGHKDVLPCWRWRACKVTICMPKFLYAVCHTGTISLATCSLHCDQWGHERTLSNVYCCSCDWNVTNETSDSDTCSRDVASHPAGAAHC